MNTIWGKSDNVKTLRRGLHWVDTPSHGGIVISLKLAQDILTSQAFKRGFRKGGYLYYEEDCDAAIVLFELPELREYVMNATDESLIRDLSRWHPTYLLERGIAPVAEQYERYLIEKEHEELLAAKSPDVIVACTRFAQPAGELLLYLADGGTHCTTIEAYTRLQKNDGRMLLLSRLLKIEAELKGESVDA